MAPPPALQRANAAFQSGDLPRAATEAEAALVESPGHPEAHYLLGAVHLRAGDPALAEAHLRKACDARPNDPERHAHLARTFMLLGKGDQATAVARTLVERFPSNPAAHSLLADVLQKFNDDEGASAALRRVLELSPGGVNASALARLGLFENLRGDHATARSYLDRALAADPHNPSLAAGAAFAANAWSDLTAQQLFDRHAEIGRRIARIPPLDLGPLANTRDLGRPLRIAYMTPDARQHSCSYFLEAILAHHDRANYNIGLYCNTQRSADANTQRLASMCDRYTVLTGMTERQAADKLIADGTDILVDLAGHTAGTGVWLLRSRIAPVQISYLGYPNTTAMPCADVRIVDAITDPPGAEPLATERLARIDPCFLCYTPPRDAPPALRDPSPRPFTFGSFNALHKLSAASLDLFAAVLHAVPHARLTIKAQALASTHAAERLKSELAHRSIDPARVDLLPFTNTVEDHLTAYQRIDAALDTTPYNGTTTTCEALLMGVPVVTLRGDRHAARVSATLLSALGGPALNLIADDTSSYVRIATSLADPTSPLSRHFADRQATHDRLLTSPLCDGPVFVRSLEAAYRDAWTRWCNEETART